MMCFGSSLPGSDLMLGFGAGSATGAVLITGGLGALGLLLASWLSGLGARRIILAGRSGRAASVGGVGVESAIQAGMGAKEGGIGMLQDGGFGSGVVDLMAGGRSTSCVTVIRCDVSSADDLHSTLRGSFLEGSSRFPAGGSFLGGAPLAAVFHAGGVLADATLRNQSPSSARPVLAPKVSACSIMRPCISVKLHLSSRV